MAKSIFERQNDSLILDCLLAQRAEYTSVKKASNIKTALTLIFSLFSIFASAADIDVITAIFGLLAICLVVFNKYLDLYVIEHKKHAASIQQYIDVTLYSPLVEGDWGSVPSATDIANSVSTYSYSDTTAVKDWYSDYSKLTGEKQVFYCQRENIRWNHNLYKSFRKTVIIVIVIIGVILLVPLFICNPSIIRILCGISWLVPIIEFGYSTVTLVNKSIERYKKMDEKSELIEKEFEELDLKDLNRKLIELQSKILECRECGFLIPDRFYKHYQPKLQKQENRTAEIIVDQKEEK